MPKRKPKSGAWKRSTRDYQQVLEDKEVDVVELLTPHHLHCPMTVQAAQAGKHISVQKPMALSAAEADEMIAAANKAGVILRVYETFVYYAPAMRAKANDRSRRDRRYPRRAHARQHRDRRYLLECAALGLAVALQRETVRRRSAGLRPRLPPVLAGLLPGWTGGEGLCLDRPDPGQETGGIVKIDAPAMIMFQYKAPRCYGQLDIEHTPKMRIYSDYYADDDRIEVIGEKGILFINRYTARTVDLPELMLFKDGKTTPVPVEGVEWHDSFIATTHDFIEKLKTGGQPRLDGPTGKAVLQFTLAALQSAATGREVRPDDVK